MELDPGRRIAHRTFFYETGVQRDSVLAELTRLLGTAQRVDGGYFRLSVTLDEVVGERRPPLDEYQTEAVKLVGESIEQGLGYSYSTKL